MGNWSGWDIAVVAVTGLQIAALVVLGVQLVRLRGNVRRAAHRGASLARDGKNLLGVSLGALVRNRERVQNTLEQASLTHAHYRRLTDQEGTQHLPFHWGRVFVALATVRTAREYLHYAQSLYARLRKRPAPAPKKTRPARRGLLERTGIVPPLWLRLRPYLPYVRTLRDVYRELQRRGVIGRKL